MMLAAVLAVTLTAGSWKAVPATGVEMSLTRAEGRTSKDALKIDFDFKGHGAMPSRARRGHHVAENFDLSFWMKAEAQRNTLEVKLIRGDDVWWSVRRELDYPRSGAASRSERNFEFAWGPGGRAAADRIDAMEIVVTAGTGGKGTVRIDESLSRRSIRHRRNVRGS